MCHASMKNKLFKIDWDAFLKVRFFFFFVSETNSLGKGGGFFAGKVLSKLFGKGHTQRLLSSDK